MDLFIRSRKTGFTRWMLPALVVAAVLAPTLTPTALNLTEVTFQISDNPTANADASWSAVAYSPASGRYLVVMEWENVIGSTDEIVGKIYQFDGTLLVAPFAISSAYQLGIEIGAGHPDVAYNSTADVFFVVWESDKGSRGQFKIRGTRVTMDGTVGGTDIEIPPFGEDAREPSVAWSSADNVYTIAWTDTDADSDTTHTLGVCQFDTDAQLLQRHRITGSSTEGFAPDICYNAAQNRYLLAYVSDINLPEWTHEIYFYELMANSLADDWGRFSFMSNAGADRDAFDPAICYNHEDDEFLVVWTGDGDTLSAGNYETFGQIVNTFGNPLGGVFQVSAASATGGPGRDSYRPTAVYNPNQNAYVVFDESDGLTADDTWEICARRVDVNGNLISPYLAVSEMSLSHPAGDGRLAAAVYNNSQQEFLVTWNGNNSPGMNNDDEVFGRISGLTALPVMFTNITATARENGHVEVQWMTSSDEPVEGFQVYRRTGGGHPEQAIVNGLLPPDRRDFTDESVQPGNTYAYSVGAMTSSGREFRSAWAEISLVPRTFRLTQNFPNPFNPSTNISYDLPDDARVSLVIYNALGRVVARLVDRKMPAGRHEVHWNGLTAGGDPAASGLYLYRLRAKTAGGKQFSQVRKMVLAR